MASNHSLFIHQSHTSFIVLLIYVDDLIITGNNLDIINEVKATLRHHFHIKYLGAIKYFLGLEVARNSSGINISQRKYTLDILANAGLLGCKLVATPMSRDTRLKVNEGTPLEGPTSYHILVGQLI